MKYTVIRQQDQPTRQQHGVNQTSQSLPQHWKNIGPGTDDQGRRYTGWPGLRHYKKVDAVLHDYGENIFLFQDDQVYLWNSSAINPDNPPDHLPRGSVAQGWPRNIADVFPGVPGGLDTAFLYYYNRKIHFVKGDFFYTWDRTNKRAKGPHRVNEFWRNVCSDYVCSVKTC